MSKNNKKGGRPPKEIGRKRVYRINLKLITEEYYSLIAKVRGAKTTISDFVRECLKKGYVRERLNVEQVDCIRKLCGMANNLNQIARRANAQGYLSVDSECRILVGKIDEIIKQMEQ